MWGIIQQGFFRQMKKSIFLFCLLALLFYTSLYASTADITEPTGDVVLLNSLVDLILEKFVDPVALNRLQEEAIKGMLQSLDPHSLYLSPDEVDTIGGTNRKSCCGIGLAITLRNGVLTVISPIEGMSAYRRGIRSGDQIRKINGKTLQGKTLLQLAAKLRGVQGTEVVLTVQSPGIMNSRDVSLLRNVLPEGSVYSKIFPSGVLYIRLYLFNSKTTKAVRRIVNSALKKDISGMILDLRDNPGGPLAQAVHLADIFLNKGAIVSVQGRGNMNRVFKAHSGSRGSELPMVVVVNGGTASSAEIVSAALQEQKRAIVVGTKTFGKGTVQNIFRLKNGGAIQLTTGRYYTPSGRSIQGIGLSPDILVASSQSVDQDKRVKAGQGSTKKERVDLQLQAARSIITSLVRMIQGRRQTDN